MGIIGPSGQRVSNTLIYDYKHTNRVRFNTESVFTRDLTGLSDRWEKRVIRVHLEQWELLELAAMLEILDQR